MFFENWLLVLKLKIDDWFDWLIDQGGFLIPDWESIQVLQPDDLGT